MTSVIDSEYKEVDFGTYCETCKHKDTPEFEDPCNDCLDTPVREGTVKPINWKGINE